LKCKKNSVGIGLLNSKVKMSGELLLYKENTVTRKRKEKKLYYKKSLHA